MKIKCLSRYYVTIGFVVCFILCGKYVCNYTDIDECKELPGVCGGGECTNLPGGYRCKCVGGLRSSRNQKKCQGTLQVKPSRIRHQPAQNLKVVQDLSSLSSRFSHILSVA